MKAEQSKVMILVLSLFTVLACASCSDTAITAEPNKTVNAAPPAGANAPKAVKPNIEELRAGKNYIATKVYSAQEDDEMLNLYKGLRVADVVDGMDKVGLSSIGTMSPDIHPLWKDTEHYTHRIQGVAVTARYVPTNKPQAPAMDTNSFDAWVGNWYNKISSEPFVPLIRKGTVLVIEEAGDSDTGSIGSNNIMGWKLAGCIGVVTSNTSRDTDEIITEKMPLYLKKVGRGIRPGRNEIESVNRPIVCGNVLVEPGYIIVADGEGVVVVPRAKAKEVAEYARVVLEKDKAARQGIYKQLGMPMDDSVK
jgi:4-hydroxy-4-methyl-2-oxoglutarate aldolase